MKKLLIAIAAALVLCVPAFATSVQYFAPQPVVLSQTGENTEHWTSTGDVYFYIRVNSSNNIPYLTAICEDSVHTASVWIHEVGDGYNTAVNNQLGNSSYYVKDCSSILTTYTTTPSLAVFDANTTDEDIASAFADYLENPSGIPDTVYNFNLPRGNVLYFQVASESDVNITSYMETLSLIVNGQSATYGPWGDTGQRYGPAAALPTSGTTFPLLSQDPIHWNKDASQNMLGQTKIGRKTVHCIAGQWYCFYNPNANHVEGGDPYQATVGATVNFKGSFSQVKVYPVSQKLSVVDGDLYSGSDDDFSSYYDGTLNENGTVSWTNQDGNIESPSAGGQNFQDGPQTADSLLEQIKITLSTVVSELQTLFTFGYEAIQSLVGLMRDFVSVFSGLYTWLPAPIYSALISAVIVAIVIGVFKVFL